MDQPAGPVAGRQDGPGHAAADAQHRATRPAADFDYLVLHEPLPAGCGVLPDSITGGFDRFEVGDGEITFHIGRRQPLTPIRYTLVGMTAGDFNAAAAGDEQPLPARRDAGRHARKSLTVLPPRRQVRPTRTR